MQQLDRSPVLNSLLRMRRLRLMEVFRLMEVLNSPQTWTPDCCQCFACQLSVRLATRISLGDQFQLRKRRLRRCQ